MNARFAPILLAAFACAGALGGCASTPESSYPSLAIRDVERITGQLETPPGPLVQIPPPQPAAQSTDSLGQPGELGAEAARAHARFMEQAPAVRTSAGRANSSPVGSENWARGEVALAGLEGIRSQTLIALADLDRIYVDAITNRRPVDQIETVRTEVSAMVAKQDEVIAGLRRGGS